jgi:hypothetical protein
MRSSLIALTLAVVGLAFLVLADAEPQDPKPITHTAERCATELTACTGACATTRATTVVSRETCAAKCTEAKARCDKTTESATRMFNIRKAHAVSHRNVAAAKVNTAAK